MPVVRHLYVRSAVNAVVPVAILGRLLVGPRKSRIYVTVGVDDAIDIVGALRKDRVSAARPRCCSTG